MVPPPPPWAAHSLALQLLPWRNSSFCQPQTSLVQIKSLSSSLGTRAAQIALTAREIWSFFFFSALGRWALETLVALGYRAAWHTDNMANFQQMIFKAIKCRTTKLELYWVSLVACWQCLSLLNWYCNPSWAKCTVIGFSWLFFPLLKLMKVRTWRTET